MRRFVRRLAATVTGRSDEDRLHEELETHVALLTDEYLAAGLPADEARRQARIKLGVGEATSEAWRDERRVRWPEDLGQDLRVAEDFSAITDELDRAVRWMHCYDDRDLLR